MTSEGVMWPYDIAGVSVTIDIIDSVLPGVYSIYSVTRSVI